MKHLSISLPILLFLSSTQHTAHAQVLFQIKQNKKIGFISRQGEIVIQPAFRSAGNFSEGLAPARLNGTYGYIDAKGNWKIPPQFDYATSFSEDLAIVYKDGIPFFINHSGNKAFNCNYKSVEPFCNNKAIVQTATGKLGVIDKSGRLVIDTLFKTIHPFIEGLAVVEGDNTTGIKREFRNKNDVVIDFTGKNTVPNGNYIGIIDSTGRFTVPYGIYSSISDFKNGCFRVETPPDKDDSRGFTRRTSFISKEGKPIMSRDHKNNISIAGYPNCGLVKMNLYKYWIPEKNDVWWSSKKSYSGYADLSGKIVIDDTTFSRVTDFSSNRAFIKIEKDNWDYYYRMINLQGKFVSNTKFERIIGEGFQNGLAIVVVDGKFEIIDTNATCIATLSFLDIEDVGTIDDYFFFKNWSPNPTNEHPTAYGIAKINGEIILKSKMQEFDRRGFQNGLLHCMIDDKLAYVNEKGKVVWQQTVIKEKQLTTLNIDFMNRGYFVAGSAPDTNAFGGYGQSMNLAHEISDDQNFPANTLCIRVQQNTTDTFQKIHTGHSVFLANTTNTTISLDAQDSRLYMNVQALDANGTWKDIEYLPNSWCGNSYHYLTLKPKQYWQFVAAEYEGGFKTKFRIALRYTYPSDKTNTYLNKKQITIYSNEYEGSINPGQFWRKTDYYPSNIMDPYTD